MRKTLLCALLVSGCGYTQVDNEVTGQVKKVHHHTPILCPNYDTVDISLGVMRNGVGSMSHEDLELTIWNRADLDVLERAAKSGGIVTVKYSQWRVTLCKPEAVIHYVKDSQ